MGDTGEIKDMTCYRKKENGLFSMSVISRARNNALIAGRRIK